MSGRRPARSCEKCGDRAGASRSGTEDEGQRAGSVTLCAWWAECSASCLRYQPVPDRSNALSEAIVSLAHRHRRYGAGIIYLKLGQRGHVVNRMRVEQIYAEAALQICRRKRKEVPVGERQPLVRPGQANEVWSMGFVFDRSAEGRSIRYLAIVDDATHESVAVVPERAIRRLVLTRILNGLAASRG